MPPPGLESVLLRYDHRREEAGKKRKFNLWILKQFDSIELAKGIILDLVNTIPAWNEDNMILCWIEFFPFTLCQHKIYTIINVIAMCSFDLYNSLFLISSFIYLKFHYLLKLTCSSTVFSHLYTLFVFSWLWYHICRLHYIYMVPYSFDAS